MHRQWLVLSAIALTLALCSTAIGRACENSDQKLYMLELMAPLGPITSYPLGRGNDAI